MKLKSNHVRTASACVETLESRRFFSASPAAISVAAVLPVTTVSIGPSAPVSPVTGVDFSSDGPFKLNSKNQLETSSGKLVYGYQAESSGNIPQKNLKVITIPVGKKFARATSNATLIGNLDNTHPLPATTLMTFDSSRGWDVNVVLVIEFVSNSATGTTWEFHANLQNNAATPIGSGTLHFDKSGHLASVTGNTLKIPQPGLYPINSVKLEFTGVSVSKSTQLPGYSSIAMVSQDGSELTTLTDYFSVSDDGIIVGDYADGWTTYLWQIVQI